MKWLSRLRLPKSFHAPIRRAEAEKESTLCLLFAQQPHPAGRQREEKRAKCVRRVGTGWEAGVGIQTGSEEVTLLILFSIFRQLRFSEHPLFRHTHIEKHTYIPILWNPQREVIRGCPLQTHPPSHLFCSAIAFCQSQQQNGRSRKKIGRKKREKKSID